jgi:hypothetical protein
MGALPFILDCDSYTFKIPPDCAIVQYDAAPYESQIPFPSFRVQSDFRAAFGPFSSFCYWSQQEGSH